MSSGAEIFSPDNQVLSLMHRHSVTPTAAQIPIFFQITVSEGKRSTPVRGTAMGRHSSNSV